MNGTQIATFVFSCLSALLTTTALVTFFIITPHKERKSSEQKAAEKARQNAVEVTEDKMLLKYIKLQNETIIASNRAISDKLDSQSQRLAVVETVVKNAVFVAERMRDLIRANAEEPHHVHQFIFQKFTVGRKHFSSILSIQKRVRPFFFSYRRIEVMV